MKGAGFLLLALVLGACATGPAEGADSGLLGDGRSDAGVSSADGAADARAGGDAGDLADAALIADASEDAAADGSSPDAPVDDDAGAGGEDASADAAVGDGGACHERTFGAAEAPLTTVSSLPAMTGGPIALGTYDVVGAYTTGSLTGTIRGSWSFVSATTLEAIEQLALQGSTPAPAQAKTFDYSASGTTLTRTLVCGSGTSSFTNEYTARSAGSEVFLDVRTGSVMFTFQRRP